MSSEFDLIQRYFSRSAARGDVALGVGDDAAVLRPPADADVITSVDTLIAGVHFPMQADAESVGHKAVAVNLSDLAAMGAEPAWLTLALSIPEIDDDWLAGFSRGLFATAERYGAALVGGDTTRGPLSITVQATGFTPAGQAITRAGARVGDQIYLTGCIGDAALALRLLLAEEDVPPACLERLHRPTPRVEAGLALRSLASAAIDVSDGLLADLGHLLDASGVGGSIDASAIPLSKAVQATLHTTDDWRLPLTGGDDYELVFTVPPASAERLAQSADTIHAPVTRIGEIVAKPSLNVIFGDGKALSLKEWGYDHFAA